MVNARLGKPEFDCLTLDSTYDCGCGDESATATSAQPKQTGTVTALLEDTSTPVPELEDFVYDEEDLQHDEPA